MKVADVLYGSVVDGPGLRSVVFFSGCSIKCPGCHNEEYQNRRKGRNESPKSLIDRIKTENKSFNKNITLSGGEPLEQDHEQLLEFIKLFKKECKKNHVRPNIWLYSGKKYTYEELTSPELRPIIQEINCLVDGPFVLEKKKEVLYRGSTNQRIIDIKKTLTNKTIVKWKAS